VDCTKAPTQMGVDGLTVRVALGREVLAVLGVEERGMVGTLVDLNVGAVVEGNRVEE